MYLYIYFFLFLPLILIFCLYHMTWCFVLLLSVAVRRIRISCWRLRRRSTRRLKTKCASVCREVFSFHEFSARQISGVFTTTLVCVPVCVRPGECEPGFSEVCVTLCERLPHSSGSCCRRHRESGSAEGSHWKVHAASTVGRSRSSLSLWSL